MSDFEKIINAITDRRVRFRLHSAEMLIERNISRNEVFNTILNGEVIEEYPSDRPFPSFLVFSMQHQRPVHVVCSYNDIDNFAVIITVYEPDTKHFEDDFRTRR